MSERTPTAGRLHRNQVRYSFVVIVYVVKIYSDEQIHTREMLQSDQKWHKLHAVGDRFAKRSTAYIFMKATQLHLVIDALALRNEWLYAVWALLYIL